jgi:hypothetical protein
VRSGDRTFRYRPAAHSQLRGGESTKLAPRSRWRLFYAPEDFPRPGHARTPVVARQYQSPRGRREDQRFNSSALLLAEPRTNPPWWGVCNRRTQGRHDEPGGTLACDAPCLGPPNEGELAKASSADRIRGVFHSRTRCPDRRRSEGTERQGHTSRRSIPAPSCTPTPFQPVREGILTRSEPGWLDHIA